MEGQQIPEGSWPKAKLSPDQIWQTRYQPGRRPAILYVHIPFCARRCFFCRHFSEPAGEEQDKAEYVEALLGEIDLVNSFTPLRELKVEAVAIGGGTPGELPGSDLENLFQGIQERFLIEKEVEYTIELNPHNITDPDIEAKLEACLRYGVNRISLGAQSFDDHVLQANGSRHRADETQAMVDRLRRKGFDNINLDLIVGLRDESRHSVKRSIGECCRLGVDHVSLYAAGYNRKSRLYQLWKEKDGRFPDRAEIRSREESAGAGLLEQGYQQTSREHFVREGKKRYLHELYTFNARYEVVSFGAGAVSWVGETCYRNLQSTEDYKIEILQERTLPIERDLVFFPAPKLLNGLAYIGRDRKPLPSEEKNHWEH